VLSVPFKLGLADHELGKCNRFSLRCKTTEERNPEKGGKNKGSSEEHYNRTCLEEACPKTLLKKSGSVY